MSKGSPSPLAARIIPTVLYRAVRHGTLRATIEGAVHEFGGQNPGPEATIIIDDAGAMTRQVLRGGGVGFAEAYINGLWHTPDLASLLELAVYNLDRQRHTPLWQTLMRTSRTAWYRLAGKVRPSAVRTMVEHYDLGNEFYAAWLDPSMSYSSGIFTNGADLETAMRTKYERIADRAGIQPGDRILEIGCGWGAMAEYAAAELGCTVTAATISPKQHDFVVRRMKEAGLEDRVDVLLADFREIQGRYDRVVSIEMIESINEASWPDLYDVIARCLVPGGTAALQVITIDHDLHTEMIGREEFMRSYIFPGGALPSPRILRRLGDGADLEWIGLSTHGSSYARTLEAWDERFVAAWPEIVGRSDRFDDRFYRMWRYYLAYCMAGFRTGRIDGVQVLYRKPSGGEVSAADVR
jgi:cyclopropane-fatty-acyl-phospholipid synthase